MSESEPMVPLSQAVRMLTTGFEWEAGLFVETYRELCRRLGREVAKEILGRAMYRAGVRLGQEARAFGPAGGPRGMAAAWDVIYGMGTKEAERLDDKRFIIRGTNCGAYELMKRWGLSAEEIRFLADAYCAGDVGHAEGFGGGEMHFQHTCRQMRGDSCCVWDFSTEPQEPSPAAVPTEDLKK